MGCAIQTCPNQVRQANPITYVDGNDPPMMLLHGQADPLVPHGQSVLLLNALRAACTDAQFFSVPGAGHSRQHHHQRLVPGLDLGGQPAGYQCLERHRHPARHPGHRHQPELQRHHRSRHRRHVRVQATYSGSTTVPTPFTLNNSPCTTTRPATPRGWWDRVARRHHPLCPITAATRLHNRPGCVQSGNSRTIRPKIYSKTFSVCAMRTILSHG